MNVLTKLTLICITHFQESTFQHPPMKVPKLSTLEKVFNYQNFNDLLTPLKAFDKLNKLENLYAKVSILDLNFSEFIAILLATPLWQQLAFKAPDFSELCLDFSYEVDSLYKDLPFEPSYHSRKHFIEVCLSTHLLVLQNDSVQTHADKSWFLSPDQCWYLLLSAMAHDVGHLGQSNQTPYEQEMLAFGHLERFLNSKSFENKITCQQYIKQIILATEPSDRNVLISRVKSNEVLSPQDKLAMLMVEADLLASVLPIKGVELGRKLSDEIMPHDKVLANIIKSSEGRLGFLKSVAFLSAQSNLLGLDQILKTAIFEIRPE